MAGQLLIFRSRTTLGGRAHKMPSARNGLSSDLALGSRTPKNRALELPAKLDSSKNRLHHTKIPPTGVEPVACALGKRRSILLSYEGVVVIIFNFG